MGSGKGSSGPTNYAYYGSLAAAVCYGPVDRLHAILCDGKAIWEDSDGLERGTEDYVDLTSAIEPKYFTSSGWLRFYWGTDTQTMPTHLTAAGHPHYRGVAVLVARHFLFGQGRSTAPNLEVICARTPVCSTDLVPAAYNALQEGQANPVAVLAELLTSPHGLGLDPDRLDTASWAAAAQYAAEHWSLTHCSPLLTDQADLRAVASQLLNLCDAAMGWTAAGTLAIRLLQPGVDPGGLPTLDAPLLTEPPQLRTQGWADVPTAIVLRHLDYSRNWKETDTRLDNLLALRLRGEHAPLEVDAPHVTRRTQAAAIAAQLLRRHLAPATQINLSVRREHAANLRPGDKAWVDTDPEPDSSGTLTLATLTERRDPGAGVIRLTLLADPLAASAPYTPTWTPDTPQAADCAPIQHALAIPLSAAQTRDQPAIAVLAARPQADAIGFEIAFATDPDGDWATLGRQSGFALRLTLDSDLSDSSDTARLTLTDGTDGPDAYLADDLPGNTLAAQADTVLLILANLDEAGQVAIDDDGLPELEFCSIITRAAVDADTHDYTLLRGRRGLPARAWTTDAVAWLIPAASLAPWYHPGLLSLLHTTNPAYLRLTAYTAYAADESSPIPQITCLIPEAYDARPIITWSTPASNPSDLPSSGQLSPEAAITDADGNLARVTLTSLDQDTGQQTTWFDLSIEPLASLSLTEAFARAGVSTPLDFGDQTEADRHFLLALRVTDTAGYTIESTRTLILPGSSGSNLGGINVSPESGESFTSSLTVTLTATGSGASQIHYAIRAIGSAEPTSWTTHSGTSKALTLTTSRRIWARASNGTDHSPWQYADYWYEGGM